MSPPASGLTSLLSEVMSLPGAKWSEDVGNENHPLVTPPPAAAVDTSAVMILESLPFDFVFVIDVPVDEIISSGCSNSRFVGPSCQGPLTTVLTPTSAAQLEVLCHQEKPRMGKRKVTQKVVYQQGKDESTTAVWNITLFPIKDKKQKDKVTAMGGLVTVEGEGCTRTIQNEEPQVTQEDKDEEHKDERLPSPPSTASKAQQTVETGSLEEHTHFLKLLPIASVMTEPIFDPETNKCIDYTFLEANQHFETMTGLSCEEVIGKRVTEVLPGIESDPANWIGNTGSVIQENRVNRFNSFSQKLNKWYEGVSYRHGSNSVITFFVQNHSENFTLDEALRESEERHRTLFENMTQGVVYHAADGRVTDVNEAALRILGLTEGQMLGKEPMDPQWKFVRHDGSAIPVEEYPIVVALQGKRVESMTFGVYNPVKNGINWLKLDAVPRFRPGENTPYEAYTIFTDMSEEEAMKKRLLRAKEKAEEADQLKSAFLATMSHEIRTPLNGIMGHIDLILSNALAEESRTENLEGLHVAMESGKLLLSIIQDILDLSKIEARQLDIDRRSFSVRDMMENTMKLANGFRMQRKKDQISLSSSVDDAIGDIVVGDEFRVQQVLNNLLSNAIKFTDEGFVSAEIKHLQAENMLQFRVSDSGKGIPVDHLELIFEPFRQSEFGDTRKHGGTGLGLTICKKLIELMGGRMRVESSQDPGKSGSCFCFTLPYIPGVATSQSQKKESTNITQEARDAEHCVIQSTKKGKRSGTILLADDDDISRKVARRMIQLSGFDVIEARNGEEAVSLFDQHRQILDCIVIDIMMPVVDGIEATKRIRSLEKSSQVSSKPVPIIALSAGAMKGDKQKGIEAGMNDYLYKPISLQILKEKLANCLGGGE